MWTSKPRGRVVKRPQADFSHRRTRLVRRQDPAPDVKAAQHRQTRYFGIRHSDITAYLEKTVPSHAFHPSNVTAGSSGSHGRGAGAGARGERQRPDTAPAATAWYGRTCTDVSDWLRCIPPAHLGLDPDNKPLPYFPSRTSIATDAKWQTKDFAPVPNVLWHWWAERPSSVPLPTSPHQVQFSTILEAIAQKKTQKPGGPFTPDPLNSPRSDGINTPRSAVSTPRCGTEASRSRAETPRSNGAAKPLETPRGALSERETAAEMARPCSGERRPDTPRSHTSAARRPDTPRSHVSGTNPPETLRCLSIGSAKAPDNTRPAAEKAPETPRSVESPPPTTGKDPETPRLAEKCKCRYALESALPGSTTPKSACSTPRSGAPGTPRPNPSSKPPNSAAAFQRPPPVPTVPRQKPAPHVCPRHLPPPPFHETIRNAKKAVEDVHIANDTGGATVNDFRLMSPDCFATKLVWTDTFKKHNRSNPWPVHEQNALESVKAY